jgi:hypothetical protein
VGGDVVVRLLLVVVAGLALIVVLALLAMKAIARQDFLIS